MELKIKWKNNIKKYFLNLYIFLLYYVFLLFSVCKYVCIELTLNNTAQTLKQEKGKFHDIFRKNVGRSTHHV